MATRSREERRRRVVELREQGVSFREIGRTLGISHELARRDTREAGLTALTVAPNGFAARGGAFWAHATETFELDRHEQELLVQVCRLLDRADALQAVIVAEGPMVTTARGETRAHPAVVEERQVSLALGRLLAQLEIPASGDEPGLRSPRSARAAKAARVRWDLHDARRGGVA